MLVKFIKIHLSIIVIIKFFNPIREFIISFCDALHGHAFLKILKIYKSIIINIIISESSLQVYHIEMLKI